MRARILAAGFLVVAAGSAPAHETWMTPSTFSAKLGEEVRLDVSSGMAFPRLENPIKPSRVAKVSYRLARKEAVLKGLKTSDTSLIMRQAFPMNGVAAVWLDLNPKNIDLTDAEVAEYLDEIDATEAIRATWARQKGRMAWKESYRKHAKTFVAIGDANGDRSWAVGVGQALELVPTTDPLTVTVGGEFTVELQAGSKPLLNVPIGLLIEGSPTRVFRTTDDDGRATFPIARGGRAMLFAVRLIPSTDGLSWTSDFCTMTFEIHRPKEGRP